MNEEIKYAVLNLLARDDVPWTWYRVDRALSQQGLGGRENIARLASELQRLGLIEITTGEDPAMPVYTLTEAGKLGLSRRYS